MYTCQYIQNKNFCFNTFFVKKNINNYIFLIIEMNFLMYQKPISLDNQ